MPVTTPAQICHSCAPRADELKNRRYPMNPPTPILPRRGLFFALVWVIFGAGPQISAQTGSGVAQLPEDAQQNAASGLETILNRALENDIELRRLALASQVRERQDGLDDAAGYAPVSVTLGQDGLRYETSDTITRIAGSPAATLRFGPDGDTRIQIASPFTYSLSGSSASSLAPTVDFSQTFGDLTGLQTADPDLISRTIRQLSAKQEVRARIAAVTQDVLTGFKTVFEEERNRIAAEMKLRDAQQRRDRQVRVLRQSATSSVVLAIDDEIAAAQHDISNASRNQQLAVRQLRNISGIQDLSVAGVLGSRLPDPGGIAITIPAETDSAFSLLSADLQVRLEAETLRQLTQANTLALTLNAGAGANLSTDAAGNSKQHFTAQAGAAISEGSTWSLGLSSAYSGSETDGGLRLSLTGTWSPGPAAPDSFQTRERIAIQELRLRQAELALENARAALELAVEDYDIRRQQLDLAEQTWRRRLAIAEATLSEAVRTEAAGLGTETARQDAELNLRSFRHQGTIIALDKLMLVQTIQRNFDEQD